MYETVVKNPIHLVETDGMEIVTTFKSFDALVRNWDWLGDFYYDGKLGPTIKKVWKKGEWWKELRRCRLSEWPAERYEFILRDSIGDYIDPETVYVKYKEIVYRRPRWGYWIPGTKHSYGRYWRAPRTTQERRWAGAWKDEEDAPKTRCRRNFRNLPDLWDDVPRSAWRDRSWKRYRKTQWKNKGPKGPFSCLSDDSYHFMLYTWKCRLSDQSMLESTYSDVSSLCSFDGSSAG